MQCLHLNGIHTTSVASLSFCIYKKNQQPCQAQKEAYRAPLIKDNPTKYIIVKSSNNCLYNYRLMLK